MSITKCQERNHKKCDDERACTGDGIPTRKSPLDRFTYCYLAAGIAIVVLNGIFGQHEVAMFLAANWLAVGAALVLIAYGLSNKNSSDIAAVTYLLGLAWLILLLVAGIVLILNDGIGVQELQWLLG